VGFGVIAQALGQRVRSMESELLIESPYFILRERAIEAIRQLKERGVKVRILTNSAISNDVIAAHAGYANTRKKLLEAGAELYELRPDSDMKRRWSVLSGKSRAALHAKCLVFDRKSVFIGSFNLDPRSSTLNTEIGVMIESSEIAAQVAEIMDEGVLPGSAFHVTLDKNDQLQWTAESDGKKMLYSKDPETNMWHRFVFNFIGILPIEDQL
jgi:putative cardiolipin synthase